MIAEIWKRDVPVSSDIVYKIFSTFIKWPILPKAKETQFKIIIINKIYGIFQVDQCSFCNDKSETLEHLFYVFLHLDSGKREKIGFL